MWGGVCLSGQQQKYACLGLQWTQDQHHLTEQVCPGLTSIQKHRGSQSLEKPNGITDKHFYGASDDLLGIICIVGENGCMDVP